MEQNVVCLLWSVASLNAKYIAFLYPWPHALFVNDSVLVNLVVFIRCNSTTYCGTVDCSWCRTPAKRSRYKRERAVT